MKQLSGSSRGSSEGLPEPIVTIQEDIDHINYLKEQLAEKEGSISTFVSTIERSKV